MNVLWKPWRLSALSAVTKTPRSTVSAGCAALPCRWPAAGKNRRQPSGMILFPPSLPLSGRCRQSRRRLIRLRLSRSRSERLCAVPRFSDSTRRRLPAAQITFSKTMSLGPAEDGFSSCCSSRRWLAAWHTGNGCAMEDSPCNELQVRPLIRIPVRPRIRETD
jgi:hypothetical protein